MSVKPMSTQDAVAHGVKCLIYGGPGTGKTFLIRTLPNPVIISAEAGLLSLSDVDIPVLAVQTIEDVHEIYAYLTNSEEGRKYDSVAIDSISEVAEVVLDSEKAKTKDPRHAYGETATRMMGLVRAFRDLPEKHVYVTAKQERIKDEVNGAVLYAPSMPGRQLGPQLPYLFDEVFALRAEKNAETGALERWLQTQPDLTYTAKDRSGRLEMYEQPDLTAIIDKIANPVFKQAA